MIELKNISDAEIRRIGEEIGKTFMAEPGIFTSSFTPEEGIQYFITIVQFYYEAGRLYTNSEKQEGFVAYWTKQDKKRYLLQIKMGFRLLARIPFFSLVKLLQNLRGWGGFEAFYKKEKNYLTIHMLVVLQQFQGQGVMKQLLEEPFALAKQQGIKCVLDTDSRLKAEKYAHYGMKTVMQKTMSDNTTMYVMEYGE